jgi:hypothetical protein
MIVCSQEVSVVGVEGKGESRSSFTHTQNM